MPKFVVEYTVWQKGRAVFDAVDDVDASIKLDLASIDEILEGVNLLGDGIQDIVVDFVREIEEDNE